MAFTDSVRRSQLIVPFGIGAMVDFPEDTLMLAGIDFWPYELASDDKKAAIRQATEIFDDRLIKRLNAVLGRRIEFLLSPTEGRRTGDPPGHHRTPMNFFRFPKWLSCPSCRRLKKFGLESFNTPKCDNPFRMKEGKGIKCSDLPIKSRKVMEPVRFLIACEDGHVDDFPWSSWVHRNEPCGRGDEVLFITSTGLDGLAGIRVSCLCGKSRNMNKAFNPETLKKHLPEESCTGRRPWLGSEFEKEDCSCSEVRTVQRGSSGIYFPNIMSSILIPPHSRRIMLYLSKSKVKQKIIDRVLPYCTQVGGEVTLQERAEHRLEDLADDGGFNKEEFIRNFKVKFFEDDEESHPTDINDEAYRFREFEAFVGERPPSEERGEFDIRPVQMTEYKPTWMGVYFNRIVRVEQLKETRAFTGFSRIRPSAPGPDVRAKIFQNASNWLPAIEVRGEGIFFEFNAKTVEDWVATRLVEGQANRLNLLIKEKIKNSEPNLSRRDGVDESFLLVHSFAHALINQLAFECGYDASSLKERIFVGSEEEKKMCGLLIYTASGDSEGSLGGLVERARPGLLERTIVSAIQESAICSNDPVCMESGVSGRNILNVSSCHACNMLPETSCEHGNYLLDRSALIGTFEKPETGYFTKILQVENREGDTNGFDANNG